MTWGGFRRRSSFELF